MKTPSNGSQRKGGKANLAYWKPGQSGNPKGRPKGPTLTSLLTDELNEIVVENDGSPRLVDGREITKGRMLVRNLIAKAVNGDVPSAKLILDRVAPALKIVEARLDLSFLTDQEDYIARYIPQFLESPGRDS